MATAVKGDRGSEIDDTQKNKCPPKPRTTLAYSKLTVAWQRFRF